MANNNNTTQRQEWFDFLDKCLINGRPEDHIPTDSHEFLQKIKLFFDNRQVVCDAKIDLSYVYFRVKSAIDHFIDVDYRNDLNRLKGDFANFRDVTNKEIFDLKNGLSKTSESLNDKLKNLDRVFKHDLEDIKREFQNNLDNSISGFLDKINETKEELETQLSDLDSKYESEINSIKSQMETFANLTSQAVENAIAKAKEEIEGDIANQVSDLENELNELRESINSINGSLGQPNGIATLDEDGKLTSSQLPDWTDDVIEVFADYSIDENGDLVDISLYEDFKKTDEILEGEEGKLYVDITSDDLTYIFRWTGREWVCVNNFATHGDITSIQSEISNIQGDVTSLKDDVENLQDTCATKDELNSAVEDLEKEISDITEEAGSEDERISALEDSVEALEGDVKVNADAIEDLQESKQDKLIAGSGIDITDNVISSTVDTTLYEVVANLPTSDIDINKIYVVPVREKGHNKCTEYIYVDGRWEILGNKVDLSDYYTTEQIDAFLEVISNNLDENTSNIEKNTSNIESNTTKISQIEDALAELGVEVGDDESKLSTIEKQVAENTAAIETKQDKLTAGTGIAINEINGETVIACTIDTSLYIFCTVLPTTDINPNKIYVTPSNDPGEDNVYIEWLYVDGAWEKIGELHSDMDMSDYYTKSEVDDKVTALEKSIEGVSNTLETTKTDLQAAIDTNASAIETNASTIADLQESKQNILVAGTNISLVDNADGTTTISCDVDTTCYKIVASLPEKPDDADVDKIFMVPSDDQESQNEFVEYIWVDTAWEQVGTNSYTKAQVDAIKDALQVSIDTLTSTVESNNASVAESIEKLESSVETLESSLESTKNDLQAAIDANTSAIETNASAIETNASNIATNTAAIETNLSTISELSENKQDKLTAGAGITINEINGETIIECTCESTITSLQEQVNNIDDDLKTAEDAIATNASAIETLQGDVASNATAIEELQSDVETKQDKLTAGTGIEINEINGETIIAWTDEQRLSDAESNIATNTSTIESLQDSKQDKLSAGYGIEITTDNIINVTLDTTLYKVVTVLPTQPDEEDENKIFVVPSPTQGDDNLYVEYLWVIDAWEKIGELHTEVDLSDYYTKSEIDSKVTDLQSSIDSNTSAIETNKEAIESNASSISALEIKHQSDIDSLNALVSDLTGVEHADFENVQSLISGLQESVTTNTANIETLQSDVSSNATAIEELQSDVEELQSVVETKQDKLTAGTGISINTINGETVIDCTLDTTIYEVVLELPTENIDPNKIYVVPNLSGAEGNECKEYLYVDGTWEEIGTFKADTDLSSYATIDYVDAKVTDLQSQIDTNTASIETNTASIETNTASIETNTSAIEELKEQISNLEGTETSDIESLKEQVATNTSNIETNANAIEELKEQVDEIDVDLSTAESNIASNTSAIETLQNSKQDKLTAGTGISINKINDETVIACTLDTDVFVVEGALPENPSEENVNKIYVVPSNETEEGNRFTEYIWIGSSYVEGAWEKLGEFSVDVDLSAYATTAEVKKQVDALDSKIESNTKAIETNTESISSLESQVSTNTSAIATNASAIEDLKGRVQTAEEAIDKMSEEIGDVEASLQDAIDNVESSLDSSIDELKERLSGDEAAIEANTTSIESNTSAIENLENTKQDALSAGTGISIENNTISCTLDTKFCIFVDKLPETGEENKLYLVKKTGTVKSDNLFDEWIWGDETGWEYIGGINPEVDLADYYTKTQVDDMINELKNSLLNDLKPYLENISSSIETLQGDVTNIKETVEDTSDDIKIITQILAGMTGTTI